MLIFRSLPKLVLEILTELSLELRMSISQVKKWILHTKQEKFGSLISGLHGVHLANVQWLITKKCSLNMLKLGEVKLES